ncbi:MAG TPA: ATP-binding protein [Candidatus Pacearchaeota archaeon]|jgi:type IV secretory pathway VirB4 component|nr:ATP-binding protein [Candidatus Pacearchaeota archaeon]HQG09067.1 ATP-binding protein [Candidatus Pacearchaeota archaeon]HQH20035.1 ATP-binding protein [Candidatus Pacearchaeota archaeon]HQK58220.1 ATP-binding protein [Candidatus Pacearchaeota archaeon]HRU20597.1 ATP-binding protein [Candidatus Paceibacterota bacterium]
MALFNKNKNEPSKDKKEKKLFETELTDFRDIVAPPSIEVAQNYVHLEEKYSKTYFVFSYPRYLTMGWLAPIINMDIPFDLSFYFHPIPTEQILKQLKKSVTEVQSEIIERQEKGLVRDPALETAFQDLEDLRDSLQTAQEKMFKFGLYITIYVDDKKDIEFVETTLRSMLESRLIYIKPSLFQQKEGLLSCFPYCNDLLQIHNTLNTSPLSSLFPFISFDLSDNEGILYGINKHNSSLVLFDRFSLENANMVIFAKAGAGKSYAVKLEILRSLMIGTECIIIDPENEYQSLAESVGGSFFKISLSSDSHINPFDLPEVGEDETPEDVLRSNVINLVGLMRIMLNGMTPEEDAIMDQAITATYAAKDITVDSDPKKWKNNVPLLSDLESVLETMENAEFLTERLRKFTQGSYSSFFNAPSNVNMDKELVVFGIRDMEDELRPIAMFIVMRYIWNTLRASLKKRILVVDEAWWMMKDPDSASFLYGICKRGRKYWLGVSTITQDVSDFMNSEYGKPIITNSSLQLLMKQSPATIDLVQEVFNLTDQEKYLLLETPVGEGIFFAGQKHVAIAIRASYTENQIITTNPEEITKIREAKARMEAEEQTSGLI